jgi:hypothetical protein
MNNTQWFSQHLQTSAEGFLWGAEQIPVERRYLSPPLAFGEWPAARHLFHLFFYEKTFALPSMRQWLGEANPSIQELRRLDEDAAWKEGHEFETLQDQFRAIREAQIALLPELSDEAWLEEHRTVWGHVNLLWVVSKTYQHTADHTNTILQMALFWDFV